jgi:Mrp family chromosome partitioning ATPase
MTSLIRGMAPMESGTTTARRAASTKTQEALAEIEKIDRRLIGLDENLQHAMSDPGSEATPRLQREMLQAMARRE